jgi:hypothetical protein
MHIWVYGKVEKGWYMAAFSADGLQERKLLRYLECNAFKFQISTLPPN